MVVAVQQRHWGAQVGGEGCKGALGGQHEGGLPEAQREGRGGAKETKITMPTNRWLPLSLPPNKRKTKLTSTKKKTKVTMTKKPLASSKSSTP